MSALGSKLRQLSGGAVAFQCPGCNETHVVYVEACGNRPTWGFNGDGDRPTFTPSVLVRTGHFIPGYEDKQSCWCTYYAEHPDETRDFECRICHSFVTDGQIQFLSDCTHRLAGQTVPLSDFGE
ncbi:DUF6527 family protein [Noviherbaspirillum sp. Root189]|uniref:DUF6527 family protein n=1 Tax=Noviherbaspirillum sp. Root189 TaxID=1736487 RepID=UPI00070D15F4|nr:DUF6527 family protein [Noviherbaspirillum sp. Root189]KRB73435.1 ammonia monooxygenase [Noviherbaspirillum sp. Root189]